MPRTDYTRYVHEFTDGQGVTRFAVAEWRENQAEYVRPFDAGEHRLTGCSAEFARRPSGVQSFKSRVQALRRARYLFGPQAER